MNQMEEFTDRDLRDLRARVDEIAETHFPVSQARMDQLWASVRETLDDFTSRLVEQELARRGHNDTLIKLLKQHQQMETVMKALSVNVNQMQEQLNAIALELSVMRSNA